MNYEHSYVNAFTSSPPQHPYSSSISSSASSSSSSVFSVDATLSQSSESTSYASANSGHVTWDTEDPWRLAACRDEVPPPTVKRVLPPLQIKTNVAAVVAPELRQHPRRCSSGSQRAPPALVRQSERKCQFVDCLVDSATSMVEVIWPISAPRERGCQGVLPLRTFIQETLRRSRTSFSTLQVALYYLILIKAHVPSYDFTMEQPVDTPWGRALQCGRRMFLAALILASKYLQDRNYSARAWSKISGLKVCEVNNNEMAFLEAVNWKLHFPEPLFDRWQQILMKYTSQQPPSPGSPLGFQPDAWKAAVLRLTPELDTVDISERHFQLATLPLKRRMTPPALMTRLPSVQSLPSPLTPVPPRVLEPTPIMPPPTPSLVRMGPLPTPAMTPQSAVSNTPAASLAGFDSRRPSYGCSAMARIQREIQISDYSNYAVDLWTKSQPNRRPSVISSTSSRSSSPESMVSDNGSRCSRASSISSASSVSSAGAGQPNSVNVKLARLATLRCAGLPYAPPTQQYRSKENLPIGSITFEPLSAEPMSSPDFESFHITDSETPSRLLVRDAKPSPCKRKRGRSSIDFNLQQNVRNLLNAAEYTSCTVESPLVLPDPHVATSFLLQTPGGRTPLSGLGPKALQSPARSVPERRLPLQKELGRKRVCASETTRVRFAPQWHEVVLDA